jgi:hypothetical protein
MPDLLVITSGGTTINYYNGNLTVSTNKTFTINHNTKPYWNTLYTVLTLHWAIPCIPTYASGLVTNSLVKQLARTNTVELNSANCST